MAIFIITGKPRHGKTYWLASQIPRWLKEAKNEGVKLYPNFKINYELLGYENIEGDIYSAADRDDPTKLIYYWRNINAWNYMSKGRILVDEASRYFNPRKWAMLSEDTEVKLQQHGKEDLTIWGTTQHYSRLDVTLRILVERFLDVQMIFGNPSNKKSLFPKICRLREYYLEDMERAERLGKENTQVEPIYQEYFFIRKKYGNLYDTRAMVGRSDPMPLIHNKRTCPVCKKEVISHL